MKKYKKLLNIILPFIIWYSLWNIFDHVLKNKLSKDIIFLLTNILLLCIALVLVSVFYVNVD